MCADICADICVDMHADIQIQIWAGMYVDMCVEMSVSMWVGIYAAHVCSKNLEINHVYSFPVALSLLIGNRVRVKPSNQFQGYG